MPAVKKQSRSINTILNDVIQRVNDDTQRLRVLEQSSESITSRVNGVEQGILQNRKDLQKALSDLGDDFFVGAGHGVCNVNSPKEGDFVAKLGFYGREVVSW